MMQKLETESSPKFDSKPLLELTGKVSRQVLVKRTDDVLKRRISRHVKKLFRTMEKQQLNVSWNLDYI